MKSHDFNDPSFERQFSEQFERAGDSCCQCQSNYLARILIATTESQSRGSSLPGQARGDCFT